MKFSSAAGGRIFVIRLENGEIVHEAIERFAREQGISAAALIALGGVDRESRLVVGPEEGNAAPVRPLETLLHDVHEAAGTGTLFLDENGQPVLHMHMACGRGDGTTTGCIRRGVKVWQVMEIILIELLHSPARRVKDVRLGFNILSPGPSGRKVIT